MACKKTDRERFFSFCPDRPLDGCWPWVGVVTATGYGQFSIMGKALKAHRYSYFLHYGEWPKYTIDHLCMNKTCVNPSHLEDVTPGENKRRWAATVTHCPNGHAYTEENTRLDPGGKICRQCDRLRKTPSRKRAWLKYR
jgi:hypothetical protein